MAESGVASYASKAVFTKFKSPVGSKNALLDEPSINTSNFNFNKTTNPIKRKFFNNTKENFSRILRDETGSIGIGSKGNVGASENLGIVQSRINIAKGSTRFTPLRSSTGQPVSAGFNHVIDGHFDRPLANSRSMFSISQDRLKSILQRPDVVKSPVKAIEGGQYVRIVDTGEIVGNNALKFGGKETTYIQIYTDKAGNLITTYPVPSK